MTTELPSAAWIAVALLALALYLRLAYLLGRRLWVRDGGEAEQESDLEFARRWPGGE